jgi:hypothetical protein
MNSNYEYIDLSHISTMVFEDEYYKDLAIEKYNGDELQARWQTFLQKKQGKITGYRGPYSWDTGLIWYAPYIPLMTTEPEPPTLQGLWHDFLVRKGIIKAGIESRYVKAMK